MLLKGQYILPQVFSRHIYCPFRLLYNQLASLMQIQLNAENELGIVMLAITLSFHIFYVAVCAHIHSITCCHLELFTQIICKSHSTVQICITNKLHDYIAWSHFMLSC